MPLCSGCAGELALSSFSRAQLSKGQRRRCKSCVEGGGSSSASGEQQQQPNSTSVNLGRGGSERRRRVQAITAVSEPAQGGVALVDDTAHSALAAAGVRLRTEPAAAVDQAVAAAAAAAELAPELVEEAAALQAEELEALEAIYGDEFARLPAPAESAQVADPALSISVAGQSLRLCIVMPAGYPVSRAPAFRACTSPICHTTIGTPAHRTGHHWQPNLRTGCEIGCGVATPLARRAAGGGGREGPRRQGARGAVDRGERVRGARCWLPGRPGLPGQHHRLLSLAATNCPACQSSWQLWRCSRRTRRHVSKTMSRAHPWTMHFIRCSGSAVPSAWFTALR